VEPSIAAALPRSHAGRCVDRGSWRRGGLVACIWPAFAGCKMPARLWTFKLTCIIIVEACE
jgi:hypothetical protein